MRIAVLCLTFVVFYSLMSQVFACGDDDATLPAPPTIKVMTL